MGGTSSSEAKKAHFSPETYKELKETFLKLSNGKSRCTITDIKDLLGGVLEPQVGARLIQQLDGQSGVSLDTFYRLAERLVKSAADETADLIISAAGNPGSSTLRVQQLKVYTESILASYLRLAVGEVEMTSVARVAEGLVADVTEEAGDAHLSCEQVERWFMNNSLFSALHQVVLSVAFGLKPPSDHCHILPMLKESPEEYRGLLNACDRLFLNWNIPRHLRHEWTLLFSSVIHGESFSKLIGRVVDRGPTVLVVKDKAGHIFGGFASQHWIMDTRFRGDENCFLMTLKPRMGIYMPTGYNRNFMYLCNQQQTFPNGIGMGGQLKYFGLWLDAEYGLGSCTPSCTTYSNPQLAATTDFFVDALEVWRPGPEPTKEVEEAIPPPMGVRPSILDVDVEGQALLRMIDRGHHSEGLRESPTADSPEDKELPPL